MKILIIDDEPMVRLSLAYALSLGGWLVFNCDQHADCVGLIRLHGIDAVISDYRMAGISGLELIEGIRNGGIDIPAFILSANPYLVDRELARRLDVVEIVAKPPDLRQVRIMVERAVAEACRER